MTAFKTGQKELKTTLGMLKSLITEAEKAEGVNGRELSDNEVLVIVQGYDKNIDKSIEAMSKNYSVDLSAMSAALVEKEHIKVYLPDQISDELIREELSKITCGMEVFDKNKSIGIIMNHFKANYPGRYKPASVKSLAEEYL